MNTISVWGILAGLSTSFGVCLALILTQRWHGRLSLDHDLQGVQKIHQAPVPRIGGIGILGGLLAGLLVSHLMDGSQSIVVIQLVACAMPVFTVGLIEDLTKKVSARMRLIAAIVSAGLAAWLLHARLMALDLPLVDTLIDLAPVSLLFTCFAVSGLTNAVNIIDGINGLASGTAILILAGLAAIAWRVNDALVLSMCLWGGAALLGFFILNYPFGRIFMGDGGAYLAGFWISECAVLLLSRNDKVSTWAVLLACFYPVFETLFSIHRRRADQHNSGIADIAHLHHHVFNWISLRSAKGDEWQRHGATSALIWAMVLTCQLLAVPLYRDIGRPIIGLIAMAMLYRYLYQAFSSRSHGIGYKPSHELET